ncbi:MAG: prephenate dehydrogenase/arogenate dehydrogenase family protein [Conexivisphaera sp.]
MLVLGLGRMGLTLALALASVGHDVSGYDPSERAASSAASYGIRTVGSSDPSGYDAVLAAVPLGASASVAREVCPRVGPTGIYADVSTLKSEVNAALRDCRGPLRISVHPLFGRGARGIAGRPIALTPIEDAAREARAASELFRGAELLIMDEAEHDEAVAYSIVLPHVLGYLFRAASRGHPRLPATSRTLQELAAAVETEDPELTAYLMARDPASRVVDELEGLLSALRSGVSGAALESMRGDWPERRALYDSAYRVLDCL